MLKNSFFKTIPFLLFIVLFTSCDKEFSVVGEDLIGDNSFDIQKDTTHTVVAYDQKIGPVQSNNLETNPLGILVNPSFGTTSATFVTQLAMATVNPTFSSAKIKSVVLSVPYFVDRDSTVTDSNGNSTYVLDSIYGTKKTKMKLSVYESGYFMRDLDPEEQLTQPQKFYTDQYDEFFQKKIPLATAPYYLNDSAEKAQNTEFFFDPAEYVVTTETDGVKTTTRSAPAMRLDLDKVFFQKKILDAPAGSLVDNTTFKNYFRGLFFNIESIGGASGELAMINFKAGKITITYTEIVNSLEVEKTFVLNLTGNTVSLLDETNVNAKYESAIANKDDVKGDYNLYLKGGQGSMSVVKLFGETDNHGLELTDVPNGISDELDDLRRNKYLINQADLILYLNSSEMGASYIPQRVYLYDYTNSQVLLDYNESTIVTANTKYNKYIFGGLLDKDKAGAYFYKFRITDHIRNLVKTLTAKNVELGLVVTEDINKYGFYTVKDKAGIPFYVPLASVMNPLGAIVFGNNIPLTDKVNYAKRLKFEIYYTKPN